MNIKFDFEGEWHELTGGYRKALPLGWEPYGDPDRMPEYGFPHPDDVHLDSLVKTGTKCIQYGLNWNTHEAGCSYLLQTEPGDRVRFWMQGRYIYDGPSSNVQPGDTVAPIHMRIGIEGIWSPEQEIAVQGYQVDPIWYRFEVEAVALAEGTRLHLYTNPTYAGFRGNGPVWDDGGVEITPGILEPKCWGQPRIQYKRIYNVVSTMEEAHRVLDLTATRDDNGILRPQTTGVSSDDAGMGMVENKTAVEWNRAQDVQENYREFYATHYPRAKLEFKSTGTEEPEMALWSQRDPRWRDYVYGGGMTLGVSGCLVTCIAMLTGDEPPACAKKLADAGVLEGSYVSRPAKIIEAYPDLSYGGTVHWRNTAADLDALAAWLENGPVVIETEFSPGGARPPTDQHFVIALELDGDDLIIADPWSGEIARLLARYALANWDLRRAIYGVRLFGHTPQGPQEPLGPLYSNLVGLHVQSGVPGDTPGVDPIQEYYRRATPSVYKTVLNFQWVRAIKEASPNTLTVIRPYPNNVTGKDAVESVINGIADDLAVLHPWLDYVEVINEQVPSGNDGAIIEAIDTEIWGMHVLKGLGYPVMPLILNVAVGNPWGPWDAHDQQPLLVKAVQASFDLFGDCVIGYHGYWPSNRTFAGLRFADVNGVRRDVGKYYSFRWQEWDKEFAKHGLRPKYINTEMGVIGTHGPNQTGYIDTLPNDGWRSSNGLGGDLPRLMDELTQWQAECAAWNETHGNRMLGGNFFTTGGGSKWSGFEFGDREMQAWAARLES